MNLAGILFDKDGTLIDFDATWGRAAHRVMDAMTRGDVTTFAHLADAMHFIVAECRFKPTSPMIAGSTTDYASVWATILDRQGGPELVEEIDRRFGTEALDSLTAIGDPAAVFASLRSLGLRLGVATNDAEGNARSQCDKLGLSGYLDFIAGYDTGHGGKPGPGMVEAFIERIGARPGTVALVGDSLHDLEAARAAGVLSVAVLTGPARRDVLAPYADHIIDSIADLPALVLMLSGRSRIVSPE